MHHDRAATHRKRMHVRHGEIPHGGGARHTAHTRDESCTAIRLHDWLAHMEEAGDQPAVVGAEPGMVGRGVDDFRGGRSRRRGLR